MPEAARVHDADGLAVLDDIGQHDDLGLLRQQVLPQRGSVAFDLAEGFGEIHQLLRGELLPPQKDDTVADQGVFQGGGFGSAQRLPQIESFDFDSEGTARGFQVQVQSPGKLVTASWSVVSE